MLILHNMTNIPYSTTTYDSTHHNNVADITDAYHVCEPTDVCSNQEMLIIESLKSRPIFRKYTSKQMRKKSETKRYLIRFPEYRYGTFATILVRFTPRSSHQTNESRSPETVTTPTSTSQQKFLLNFEFDINVCFTSLGMLRNLRCFDHVYPKTCGTLTEVN
jgi:hypothetical protein